MNRKKIKPATDIVIQIKQCFDFRKLLSALCQPSSGESVSLSKFQDLLRQRLPRAGFGSFSF
jgi:hypothetical protein